MTFYYATGTFLFRLFLLTQCGLVLVSLKSSSTSAFPQKNDASGSGKITLEQVYAELRSEPSEYLHHHLALMFTISGHGGHLYNMAAEMSAECSATVEATLRMLEKLKICEETLHVVVDTVKGVDVDIKKATELKHPLEFMCRRLENGFAKKSSLQTAFELIKKSSTKNNFPARPSYSDTLFDSLPKLGTFLISHLTIHEIARSVANEAFRHQLKKDKAYSSRYHLLAKTIVAVAQNDKFGSQLQSMFDKTLEKTVSMITVEVKSNPLMLDDKKTFWFLPKMIRMFYGFIAEDKPLKNELEKTAALVGKEFDKSDFEFSTI